MRIDNPDFPVRYPFIVQIINEKALKMFEAKVAPYIETDPETGKKTYRRIYQPQVDAASREAEEWKTRVKDKAEKYIENETKSNSHKKENNSW